jgi:hypothetical protein
MNLLFIMNFCLNHSSIIKNICMLKQNTQTNQFLTFFYEIKVTKQLVVTKRWYEADVFNFFSSF